MTQEELERAAQALEEAASELERAVGHCRVAAEHFRNVEQPRATAHAWAARGHILKAEAFLDQQARDHSAKALLPGDEGYR